MVPEEDAISTRPDAKAVKRRAAILVHIFLKALATPPAPMLERLASESAESERSKFIGKLQENFAKQKEKLLDGGLWQDMEETEREFMDAGPFEITMRHRIDASWLAESIMCLLWSLRRKEHISPYDQEAGLRPGKAQSGNPLRDLAMSLLAPFSSDGTSTGAVTLRSEAEIDRERDWAELWHWRCRTHMLLTTKKIPDALPDGTPMTEIIRMTAEKAAREGVFVQTIGGDFPVFGKAFRDVSGDELSQLTSIAMERHKALNWLCGYAPGNRWSNTPTDT